MKQGGSIGKPVARIEDRPLLTGAGRFVDDLRFPGMLQAAFVRSPHAHAPHPRHRHTTCALAPVRARGAYACRSAPRAHPGTRAAWVSHQRASARHHAHSCSPSDEVAFVGEAVAVVIAQTRYVAEDAAALVEVDYEVLPAVSDCRAALEPGAPRAHRGRASNLLMEFKQSYGDVDRRLCARTASRARCAQTAPRRRPLRWKGRGALAAYDSNEDRLTLWTSTQLAHEVRGFLMQLSRARREPAPRSGARRRRRVRRQVPAVSRRGDARRRMPHAAPAGQMGRGSPRAFPRRGTGARPVLGPRSRVRRRRPAARRAWHA